MTLLAQIDDWQTLIQVMAQYGFPALIAILLLWFIREDLIKRMDQQLIELRNLANSIDRNTISTTSLVLSMHWLPSQFKDLNQRINEETQEAMRVRAEEEIKRAANNKK